MPEVIITAAISVIAIYGGARLLNSFISERARQEAAANAESEIDKFIKILKRRWVQRDRPASPLTDMPGPFTSLQPGFLWTANPNPYPKPCNNLPACYTWATTGCTSNSACKSMSLLISSIDPTTNIRTASWLGIRNDCNTYAALNKFDYFNGSSNSCRCADTLAKKNQVNQVIFDASALGDPAISYPPDPSQGLRTNLHSLAVCFSWPLPTTWTTNSRGDRILPALLVDIEAAYIGARNKIYFSRRKISLPVDSTAESPDSIRN